MTTQPRVQVMGPVVIGPVVIGVVNVTDDSFSDGGRYLDPARAVQHGLALAADGAAIIDVGGESTRPGAVRIDADVEIARVIPVVKGLAAQGLTVSIDTMHAAVARAALDNGAAIVNDVSGGQADPAMAPLIAEAGVPWVLMHWRSVRADQPHSIPHYDDVVVQVRDELLAGVEAAVAAGVARDNMIIDPGLGFAKTAQHNWAHRNRDTGTGRGDPQAFPRFPVGRRRRDTATAGRPGDCDRGHLGTGSSSWSMGGSGARRASQRRCPQSRRCLAERE